MDGKAVIAQLEEVIQYIKDGDENLAEDLLQDIVSDLSDDEQFEEEEDEEEDEWN
jgi:hypothetical protein